MGLGYIVGLKYAAIIAAGSFVSWFVFIPLVSYFGQELTVVIGSSATDLIADMTAEDIFSNYVRHIGIGGIAAAGIVGILKSSPIIVGAIKLAWAEIVGGKALVHGEDRRTSRDLPLGLVGIMILASFDDSRFDASGAVGDDVGGDAGQGVLPELAWVAAVPGGQQHPGG